MFAQLDARGRRGRHDLNRVERPRELTHRCRDLPVHRIDALAEGVDLRYRQGGAHQLAIELRAWPHAERTDHGAAALAQLKRWNVERHPAVAGGEVAPVKVELGAARIVALFPGFE